MRAAIELKTQPMLKFIKWVYEHFSLTLKKHHQGQIQLNIQWQSNCNILR
jgi:hypothetical protein